MTATLESRSSSGRLAASARAALWRVWMVVRSCGRAGGWLAKAAYVGLAVTAIAALAIGVLTLTVGGLIADASHAVGLHPPGLSREATASAATLALVGLVVLAATVRVLSGDPVRPLRAARGVLADARSWSHGFRDEWSTAGAALVRRRRAAPRRSRRGARRDGLSVVRSDEPLVGYRLWLVAPVEAETAGLIAPVSGLVWQGPVVEAKCDVSLLGRLTIGSHPPHDEPAPHVECMCGLYALKRSMWPTPNHRAPVASGRVRLSGRVVEGSRGYRAQRAEIVGPLRVALVCAGTVEKGLWTEPCDNAWEPTPPGPCPFEPSLVAAGPAEYVALCPMHASQAGSQLDGVPVTSALALQAQLELRYGVEVAIRGRGPRWT